MVRSRREIVVEIGEVFIEEEVGAWSRGASGLGDCGCSMVECCGGDGGL